MGVDHIVSEDHKIAVDQKAHFSGKSRDRAFFCIQIFKKSEDFRFFKYLNAKKHCPGFRCELSILSWLDDSHDLIFENVK